jgi:peptidoglycan/xylan/chitin deacetylase (PgdA/CDA1 family)
MEGVVHRGDGARPQVALTYDDGPGRSTRLVLDLLERHGARATFFFVGHEAERDPELAREVAAAGHDVGSHSMHHLDHDQVGPDVAVADMVDGARAVAGVLGFEPKLYRAPYGHFTTETVAEARRRAWTCVHWSALGEDWEEGVTGHLVADRIFPRLGPGAIVLLHDSRRAKAMNPEPVVTATSILLEALPARGLRAVTVGEMMCA